MQRSPVPIKCSDNRSCYRCGSAAGFTVVLLVVALLAGFAGLSEAASLAPQHAPDPTATGTL